MPEHRRIFDTFLFYNEFDLLELRLVLLWDVVDVFVVTECHETFSGHPKPMAFAENRDRYARFADKIVYNPIAAAELERLKGPEFRDWVTDLTRAVPHKHSGQPGERLAPSLKREISHRDAIVLGLLGRARPDDIVLVSDVDEIPAPERVADLRAAPPTAASYFRMEWFLYWLNNRVDQPWFGTVAAPFACFETRSVDLLRYSSHDEAGVPGPVVAEGGWHFSYLGGAAAIAEKLRSMPFQGRRAEVSMWLNRLFPGRIEKLLRRNGDILFKGRHFEVVPFDGRFPAALRARPDIVDKYLAASRP